MKGTFRRLKIGVSGVRGVVGESLSPVLVADFAAAFGEFAGGGRVLVGRDTRSSGEMYENAVAAGTALCRNPAGFNWDSADAEPSGRSPRDLRIPVQSPLPPATTAMNGTRSNSSERTDCSSTRSQTTSCSTSTTSRIQTMCRKTASGRRS